MQKSISSPLASQSFAAWRAEFALTLRQQCSTLGRFCFSVFPHHGLQTLRSCFVVLFRIASHYEKHSNTVIANNRFKRSAEMQAHFVVGGVRRARLT